MITFDRLERLQNRRLDPTITVEGMHEVYDKINDDPAIRYAVGAMQPIDNEYTANTYKESERVQNQLTKPLQEEGIKVEYDHQGSVTNDTHIKAHSDIDTLVIHTSFITIEPPQEPEYPYKGSPIKELKLLRQYSTNIVKEKFPKVTVNTSGSMCVNLEGGSLRRKIDLVFCNWWDTKEYYTYNIPYMRGIKVLNNEDETRIENKPFLHNKNIDDNDKECLGNVRKLIRLIKSLIYDSETPNALSSYDVASIIYNMPTSMMTSRHGQELQLMQLCSNYLHNIINDHHYRSTLDVPNKTRKVFCKNGASLGELTETTNLFDELLIEIEQGLTRSFRKLEEARVEY